MQGDNGVLLKTGPGIELCVIGMIVTVTNGEIGIQ